MSEQSTELTGSIFDEDVDIDEIPNNPNHLPEDVYVCRITKAVMALTKNKDKVGLTITYQIIEGEYSTSFPFTEWLHVPQRKKEKGKPVPFTVEEQRSMSRIKKHFEAAGFPADKMKGITPADLVGRELKVRTANKKQDDGTERINVRNVMPIAEGSDDGFDAFSDSAAGI